jgi:hypothetical protein
MLRTLDLNTQSERNAAHAFALQTKGRLSVKDSTLPQVIATCEMVQRGIGVVGTVFYLLCLFFIQCLMMSKLSPTAPWWGE